MTGPGAGARPTASGRVAQCLLASFPMWFLVDEDANDGEGMERVLPQLKAIVQFTEGLEQRLAAEGVDGVAGVLELYRHLKAVLDGIPSAELACILNDIAALESWLAAVARSLDEVKRLKELVATEA